MSQNVLFTRSVMDPAPQNSITSYKKQQQFITIIFQLTLQIYFFFKLNKKYLKYMTRANIIAMYFYTTLTITKTTNEDFKFMIVLTKGR